MRKWMKISKMTVILVILCHLAVSTSLAQSPERFSYQALVRNAANVVLVNQTTGVRISILQGSPVGASVYVETHTASTNAGGIVSLEIGGGSVVSGTFATIDWSNGPYYIKTETDPSGGSAYSISGTLQLMSVPYAMYSKAADFNNLENKPSLDGSETKVSAGTAITVSGSGTTPSPYLVNFSIQWLTQAQRIGLAAPYAGQIIWCSNCGLSGELQVYNGTIWTNWCGGAASPILPSVTTTAASSITAFTASSGGNVTSDGGGTVTSRGVCWSTSANPTTADSKTSDGSGTGSFTSSIAGLNPVTTYYVRAYATNSTGTSYGNQVSFTTLATVPSLTTTAASSIASTTATSGGDITSDGGASVTVRGVCWSTSANPTTANSKTTDGGGIGTFTSSITGLSPGTLYYVRAYATNSAGTSYGTQISFTTTAALPTLTTTAVTPTIGGNASTGGNISSDGGSAVTARGVCWSTSASPTIANSKTTNGSGTGVYASAPSGLTLGTKYYLRAYATNGIGTAYGNEIVFFALAIGDTYQGGKVAYILLSGDPGYDAAAVHGLIAETTDQSSSALWGCSGTDLPGATGMVLGTGSQNTNDIVNNCLTIGIAAELCASLSSGGYTDWYLPSRDELIKMCASKALIGGMPGNFYWSSSETGTLNALWIRTSDCASGVGSKPVNSLYVRAARSF
jgi:hypothetical protein